MSFTLQTSTDRFLTCTSNQVACYRGSVGSNMTSLMRKLLLSVVTLTLIASSQSKHIGMLSASLLKTFSHSVCLEH